MAIAATWGVAAAGPRTASAAHDKSAPRSAHRTRSLTRAFLDRPHPLLIGGEWIEGRGRAIAVENPARADLLAEAMTLDNGSPLPSSRMVVKHLAAELFRFTGQIAYRFLVDRAHAEPFLEHGRGALFLGPGATLNRYTLRAGTVVNCVGIVRSDRWADEGWQTPATRDELLGAFDGWRPQVTGLTGRAERLIKWSIFDRAPLPEWSRGRVTLLGDSAHAMLPFLGLGAALAIEDGMILARAFAAEPDVAAASPATKPRAAPAPRGSTPSRSSRAP